jgi:thiamine transport system permease protein
MSIPPVRSVILRLAKILLFSFLVFFILLPSSFVLIFLARNYTDVSTLLTDSFSVSVIVSALVFSLRIAVFVSLIDFLIGLPFAWLLTRTRFPGVRLFENLISLPLALPTSALGFSAAIFWAYTRLPLSSFWFLSLIHISFTFPFVVGVIGAALKKETVSLEQAATILGAPKITVLRTIILPQIKLEVITSLLFSFARSLSETGATIVALEIFGASQLTAPALIAQISSAQYSQIFAQDKMLLAAVISGILIVISLLIFGMLRFMTKAGSFPIFPRLVGVESRLSKSVFVALKDAVLFVFLFGVVLLPPFFIISRSLQVQKLNMGPLTSALATSFFIALCVTLINLFIGTPTAYFLVRSQSVRIRKIINFLVDIPLLVPTVALGFSLGLYWRLQGFITSDLVLIVFAHIAFTYPYIVRTLYDAFAGLNNEFIEASRSLGASPFKVFQTISLPLLAPTFSTAAILVLARSLGETGATMAVSERVLTAPVFIVDLVKTQQLEQAGIASAILISISFFIFTLFRRLAIIRR